MAVGNVRMSEDSTSITIALVRSKNDTSSFVTSADELKERGAKIIEWLVSHLFEDKKLGREIDAHALIQSTFAVGASKIVDRIMCRHKYAPKPP
jgi:hypothetical protein